MLLLIRKMQVKTAIRDCLTPVRMAMIKMSTDNKCWRGYGEKGTLLHCWWDCKLVRPPWRTVWEFLKKLKTELPLWYSNPTPRYISRKDKSSDLERYVYPHGHSRTNLIAKTWKQTNHPSTEERIKKMWYIYNEILLSRKNEWNNAICNSIDGPRDHHAKWSKSKQVSYDITDIRNLNTKDTNELIYKTGTDSET